jgi:hypothetical protein
MVSSLKKERRLARQARLETRRRAHPSCGAVRAAANRRTAHRATRHYALSKSTPSPCRTDTQHEATLAPAHAWRARACRRGTTCPDGVTGAIVPLTVQGRSSPRWHAITCAASFNSTSSTFGTRSPAQASAFGGGYRTTLVRSTRRPLAMTRASGYTERLAPLRWRDTRRAPWRELPATARRARAAAFKGGIARIDSSRKL